MCTAISFLADHHYFGRNLDLEYHYSESVTITPRNYPFTFRKTEAVTNHPAIIGIATVIDGYPLYYDAVNEYGLCAAALNFPGNAVYNDIDHHRINISAFELIPYLLGKFRTISDVKENLKNINIVDISFNSKLPLTPLHWFVADQNETIVIEQTSDGLNVYDNPFRLLTNNPPFPYHLENINNYMNLTANEPTNRFSAQLELKAYSRGLGAIGLPGDLSSASRFIRGTFVLHNAKRNADPLSQFFHILSSVEQQEGCVHVGNHLEKTVYTSCCDADLGIYYYTTYENRQITGIKLKSHDLSATELTSYPLRFDQKIYWESK